MKVSEITWSLTMQTFDDKGKHPEYAMVMGYDEKELHRLNDLGAGVYWCINPQETTTARGIKRTTYLACIGLDCDITKETDASKGNVRLPDEEVEEQKIMIFSKITELSCPPSGGVWTRNGVQPFWIIKNPIPLKDEANRISAEELYVALVKGFTKATGIKSEGDSISRVLRMPGFNHMKSDTPYLCEDLYPQGVPCEYADFIKAYPLPVKEEPKQAPKADTSKIKRLEDIPVKYALEQISGKPFVNNEVYTFKSNTNGTVQVIINGKLTGQWLDITGNKIGGPGGGMGNPTIIQWLAWYLRQKGNDDKKATALAYSTLYPILLPHIPYAQWDKEELTPLPNPGLNGDELIKYVTDPNYAKGIYTGYTKFDTATGGLRRQFTYLIGAKAKNLKSMFALNILVNIARKKYPTAYFDLENGPNLGNRRLVQIYSGWSNEQMEKFIGTDGAKLKDMVAEIKRELPIYPIYHPGDLGKEDLYKWVIRYTKMLVEEYGVRAVGIDNMNVFTSSAKDDNSYKGQIMTEFDAMANNHNISVIIVHHASEKEEGKGTAKIKDLISDKKKEPTHIPLLSKLLGTSALVSKSKVGMTLVQNKKNNSLWVWIQANRDAGYSKPFRLQYNQNNHRITNPVSEWDDEDNNDEEDRTGGL